MNVFAPIGRAVLNLLAQIGRLFLFTVQSIAGAFTPPVYGSLIVQQILRIGYFSLPVVGLTAFFTGGVLALQIYNGAARYGAESFVPVVVLVGITRELGPVIAGLMVAGRVAAAIAAEIGTMKVTEQIDALTTLSTNPIKYLVVPRLVAAVISMPILVAIASDPEILFFDEPTTGLDPIMADVINDLIVSTVKDLGVTAVSITHDLVSARKISDRIAMLYKGKIIWQGPTKDIDNSGNPYVDQFIHGRADGPIKMEVKA